MSLICKLHARQGFMDRLHTKYGSLCRLVTCETSKCFLNRLMPGRKVFYGKVTYETGI